MKNYENETQKDYYMASLADDAKIIECYLNLECKAKPPKKIITEIERFIKNGGGIAKWLLPELETELAKSGFPEHGLELDGCGNATYGPRRTDKRLVMLEQASLSRSQAPLASQATQGNTVSHPTPPTKATAPVAASQAPTAQAPAVSPVTTVDRILGTAVTAEPAYTNSDLIAYLKKSNEDKKAMIETLMNEIDKLNEELLIETNILKTLSTQMEVK